EKDKELQDKFSKAEEKSELIDELEDLYADDQEVLEKRVYNKEKQIESKIKKLDDETAKYTKK
ncbi:hypothetical protein GUG22_24955, partial [Xanthomonas citri pv. citri]|nr:hypothetical protein [Xanthomonas citri pv. citri]